MSIIAVQVATGKEILVKQTLLKHMEYLGETWIQNIYAFETFTQSVGKRVVKKVKSIVSSYIFLEIDNHDLQPEEWHFVKRVPFVQKILGSIPEDQFDRFFQVVSIEQHTEEDPEVIVSVQNQKQEEEILHRFNAAKTKEDKRYWLRRLQSSVSTFLERLKYLANNKISICYYTGLKKDRITIRMPYSLYKEIEQKVDPQKKMSEKLYLSFVERCLEYVMKEV